MYNSTSKKVVSFAFKLNYWSISDVISFMFCSTSVNDYFTIANPTFEINYNAYLCWLTMIHFLDLATSKPKKYYSAPRSFNMKLCSNLMSLHALWVLHWSGEPISHFHINFFNQIALKKCIINVHLHSIPDMKGSSGKNGTHCHCFAYLGKRLSKINGCFLSVSFYNQSPFVYL